MQIFSLTDTLAQHTSCSIRAIGKFLTLESPLSFSINWSVPSHLLYYLLNNISILKTSITWVQLHMMCARQSSKFNFNRSSPSLRYIHKSRKDKISKDYRLLATNLSLKVQEEMKRYTKSSNITVCLLIVIQVKT